MRCALPFAILLAASCGGLTNTTDPSHCRDSDCVGGEVTVSYTAVFNPLLLDIVVIVDDAVPSGPGATLLGQALRQASGYIDEPPNGRRWGTDVNVVLVPASYATATPPPPLWPGTPACPQPSGPFLRASQLCDTPNNFAGGLPDALACAAGTMPTSGSSPHVVSTLHALLANGVAQGGFRRPEAALAVMLVSTSDDSDLATPAQVAEQHDYLTGLVDGPEDRLAVGIVAPASAQGLVALSKSFAAAGSFSAIDASSWPALPNTIDSLTWHEWWPVCLDGAVADADPNMDGVQPDCICTEIPSAAQPTEAVLPRCPDSGTAAAPCWKIANDLEKCPGSGLEFVVDNAGSQCMPSHAVRYSLTCAIN